MIGHLLPAVQKLAAWASSSRETFPFCFSLPKSVFFPSETKIAMKKEILKKGDGLAGDGSHAFVLSLTFTNIPRAGAMGQALCWVRPGDTGE